MTIQEINALYQETFYTKDNAVLPLMISIIVGSKLKSPPVWLYIVGPSSGGKSELITALSKVPFVTQISDLTPNTFLSGFSNNKKEASLLKQLGLNFVVVMKDFTTLLSKSQESQEAIIAQMREIYDGHMTKYTGTGQVLEWGPGGKGTFVMAATEGIYSVQEKFSDMGTRAINYVLLPQHRKETTRRALTNTHKTDANREKIQNVVRDFVEEKILALPAYLPDLPEDIVNQIIDVADFAAICRSVVKRDYRGEKSLALSAEMPMRMAKQLLAIGQQLNYIYDGNMPKEAVEAIFKTGFDSIPKQRRIILEVLSKYDRVNVTGVADKINYNPQRSREWIEDLNMFGVTRRIRAGRKEYWELKPEYKEIMKKYFKIEHEGEMLEGADEVGYVGAGNYQDVSYDDQQENADMDATF